MKRIVYGMLVLATAVSVAGCGGSTNSVVVLPDPVVRFINASPNSAGMDMFANDVQVANNVPYLGSNPTFVSTEQGDYDIKVQETSDPTGETQAIEVKQMNRDQDFLAFSCGLVTPPNTEFDKRLRCSMNTFNRTRPNGDKARLIVFNAYVAAPGLDTPSIDFQNPGDTPRFSAGDIPFGEGRELTVDAGPDTFVARRNGTELEIVPQNTFTFGGGKIYAAVVTGIEDSVGATAPKIVYIELQTR
jgi:hypothetical protein